MNVNYSLVRLDENNSFLDLGAFYGGYVGSYFYYQRKVIVPSDSLEELEYAEYVFHLNINNCNEVDKEGNMLPILMVHISKKGLLLPNEILKDIRCNDNKVYFISKGYADFSLSIKKPDVGLSSKDEEFLIKLFKDVEKEY